MDPRCRGDDDPNYCRIACETEQNKSLPLLAGGRLGWSDYCPRSYFSLVSRIELSILERKGLTRSQTRYRACGCVRTSLLCSLFSALRYALAEATMMSVSAPCPFTMRPSFASRTVTSPCESVPLVIALTE